MAALSAGMRAVCLPTASPAAPRCVLDHSPSNAVAFPSFGCLGACTARPHHGCAHPWADSSPPTSPCLRRLAPRAALLRAPLSAPRLLARLPNAARRPAATRLCVSAAAAVGSSDSGSGSQGLLASLSALVAKLLPAGVLGAAVGYFMSSVAGLPAVLTAG